MRPLSDRFEAKVDRSGGPDACHPWTGALAPKGYGQFRLGADEGFRLVGAHFVAFRLAGRLLPDGHIVGHRCHDLDLACPGGITCPHRACCNAAHLAAQTGTENTQSGRASSPRARLAVLACGHARGAVTNCNNCITARIYDRKNPPPVPRASLTLCQGAGSVLT